MGGLHPARGDAGKAPGGDRGLPYIAAKKPIEIDISKNSIVYLNIIDGAAVQASEDDGVAMQLTVLDGVTYQETGEPVQRAVLSPPRHSRAGEPEPDDYNNFPPGVTKLDW